MPGTEIRGHWRNAAGALTLRDRLLDARDRLLASDRFRRWAAAFPLTRPVARRRARALFDLVAGFVYSQVLLACVRVRLFDILAEGAQTAEVLGVRLAMPVDAAIRLLEAAVALQLVSRRGRDRYGLGPLGATMVGNGAVAAMVEHHTALYADLQDPVALLRGHTGTAAPALAGYWPYAGAAAPAALGSEQTDAYTALMSASQPLVAGDVLDAYPLSAHRCLLDVGGGAGTFVVHAAARAPQLRLMLFDLPPVAQRAQRNFAAAGIGDRAASFGGDFLADPLPPGADIATLVRVIHDHDDANALRILQSVRRALPATGTLLLAEPMSGTPGAEAVGAAYFGFYLLAMGSGRPRTPAELEALLRAAGFGRIRHARTPMPLQTGLLVARVT